MLDRKTLLTAASAAAISLTTATAVSADNAPSVGETESATGDSAIGLNATATITAENPKYCELGAEAREIEFGDGSDDFDDVVKVEHGCNFAYSLKVSEGSAFERLEEISQDGVSGNKNIDKIPWNFTGNGIPDKEFGEDDPSYTLVTKSVVDAVKGQGDNFTEVTNLDLLTRNEDPNRAVASGTYEATVTFTIAANE
jgi:hypothetical protein